MQLKTLALLPLAAASMLGAAEDFYQPSTWTPRVTLPTRDALQNFWPKSPSPGEIRFDEPGLARERLGRVPAPGVHPRVYLPPDDVAKIRANIALGDKAPPAFQNIWARCLKSPSPLTAYLLQDDDAGKRLAAEFMAQVKKISVTIDALNRYPDRDNLFTVEKSIVFAGDPAGQNSVFGLLAYDYLHQWLTPEQRAETEQVIARAIKDRIGNFMSVPDHFMINNHQCFGMEYMALLLLLEGQKGFPTDIYNLAAHKMEALLNYYITADGMCYETIKGWLPMTVFVPLFRRNPELAKHSRLHAKMRFYAQWLRAEDGKWKVREEMRDSAFPNVWMMHYLFPENPVYSMLYAATFNTNRVLFDPSFRWSNPVGTNWENLLLSAQEIPAVDYSRKATMEALKVPLFWTDAQRGYYSGRTGWGVNDIYLNFAGKQDMVYCGHEGPEQGRWSMWADGVNWIADNDLLFNKNAIFQNMISIDGRSIRWAPASSVWLGAQGNGGADWAATDYKDAYTYRKTNTHPFTFPSLHGTYWSMFADGNLAKGRDNQLQYHDSSVKFFDGYAHTDYGLWNGEQRLLEDYRLHNPMEKAFRTVILSRGEKPYVIMLDDLKKDDASHLFRWNAALPDDVVMLAATNPGHNGMEGQAGDINYGDILLGKADTPRNDKRIYFYQPIYQPRKGAPQLLVRMLNRRTEFGYPMPSVERTDRHNVLNIPAQSVEPDFKTMLFPHRAGEPLPTTKWNDDRTRLEVKNGKDLDVWHFAKTDGGRTAFALERNGKWIQRSNLPPAAPVFSADGRFYDRAAARYTRYANQAPEYLFDRTFKVAWVRPAAPAVIRYTLDGSEVNAQSPVYTGPFSIDKSATVKARVFDPDWVCGDKASATTVIRAVRQTPALAESLALTDGLRARVYEINTVIWDDKGFFRADKVMMPDLDRSRPVLDGYVTRPALPHSVPRLPQTEQSKAFYRFNGYFDAPATGLYRFTVKSNGPVTLTVAGRQAISEKGVFHLNWKSRSGEAVLAKGPHQFELIVTDPMYWKSNTEGEMPFEVTCRYPDGAEKAMTEVKMAPDANRQLLPVEAPVAQPAPADLQTALEPGVEMRRYLRPGKQIMNCLAAPDLLDVEQAKPLQSSPSEKFQDNDSNSAIVSYDGFFYAPEDGVYTFESARRGDEKIDFNSLRIGGETVIQHGIPGRNPGGKIDLKKGYYTFSFRLGASRSDLAVTLPGGQKEAVTALRLFRPAKPRILPEGERESAAEFEIYAPTRVAIVLPEGVKCEIRYTLDKSEPTASSPRYDKPFPVEKSTTVRAAGFDNGRRVTEECTGAINRVVIPQRGQILHCDFTAKANDRQIPAEFTAGPTVWGAFESRVTPDGLSVGGDGKADQSVRDVNIDKSQSGVGLVVKNLNFDRSAMTVAMDVTLPKPNAKLFGKWGFNAIGKGYTTVRAELNSNTLRAEAKPSRVQGGKIKPGERTHIVFTGDVDRCAFYVNGKLTGVSDGSPNLATESLDMLIGAPATIHDLRIYKRALTAQEAERLYQHSRPQK